MIKSPINICTLGRTLFILFALISCNGNTAYHTYQNLPSAGWQKQDTLEYILPSYLAGKSYQMEIGLRHTENYAYQDIWLKVLHPLSPQIHPDTLHLKLADQWGNWQGKGTSGNLYQYTNNQVIHLSSADSLLQIVHIMRDNPLKGISDVGIKLSPLTTSSINTQKNK